MDEIKAKCVLKFFQLGEIVYIWTGLTIASVPMAKTASLCSNLVLIIAMRRIDIFAHMSHGGVGSSS